MSLSYFCDACDAQIPAYARRINCLECEDHMFCMTCHNGNAVSKIPTHRATHSTELLLTESHLTPRDPSPTVTYPNSLCLADGTASPSFINFCDIIFTQLNTSAEPTNTRLLEPSKLAAAERELGTINLTDGVFATWKQVIDDGGTPTKADETLAAWYKDNDIECVMTTRESDEPVWYGMPALTRASFLDLQMFEMKRNPEGYLGWFTALLRTAQGQPTEKEDSEVADASSQANQQGQELADQFAILKLAQNQQMQMEVNSMMHAQRMRALSYAYGGYPTNTGYYY